MATIGSSTDSLIESWLCEVDANSIPPIEPVSPKPGEENRNDPSSNDKHYFDCDPLQVEQPARSNNSLSKATIKRKRSSCSSDDCEPPLSPSKRIRLTMDALESTNLGAPVAPNNLPTPEESSLEESSPGKSAIVWDHLKSNTALDAEIISNPKVIGDLLTRYGLKLQDPAIHNYPSFRQHFLNILLTARKTPMKDGSAKKIEDHYNYYYRNTENTFMSKVFLPTVGDGRHPMPDHFREAGAAPTPRTSDIRSTCSSPSTTAQRLQDEVLSHVGFFDDGIASTENADFVRGIMLTGATGDTVQNSLVKAMAKAPGWTNPRPDYVYGFREDWPGLQTPADATQNLSSCFEIAPDTKLPFCIVEARGDGGCLAGAEDQARRAGAAGLQSHRFLIDMSENMKFVPPPGPDYETAIFTVTASPASVVIWLNWVEFGNEVDKEGKRSLTYHMNKLRSYHWDERDSLSALRAAFHNIMDWAVYDRLPKAKALHTKVYETMRMQPYTAGPKRKATATPKSSPQKSSSTPIASKKSRAAPTTPQATNVGKPVASTPQPPLFAPKTPNQPLVRDSPGQ
ncbi:MAG: hypothetical protein Q9208_007249 [Pyrenodesmia sp. 3 TL-2023]